MKDYYKQTILAQLDMVPPMTYQQWLSHLQIGDDQLFHFEQAYQELIDNYDISLSNKNKIISASEKGYLKGKLDIVGRDFGFVDDEKLSIYVRANNFLDAMDKDEVVVHYKALGDDRYEGEIVKVIKRHTTIILGTLEQYKQGFNFKPYEKSITTPIHFSNPDNLNLEDKQRVIATITKYGDPIHVDITSILGLVTDPGVDILTILYQHGITMEFSDATIEQVKTISQTIEATDYPNRKDLRNDIIFTIDGDDTKDIDDAISLIKLDTGYRLGVHIADVSHYVQKGSPLDDDAYERGTSVYVVDRVVPMLPKELSNGICSLNPNVDRLAMSVHINLDEYGSVVNYEFFESIIQSKAQLTYREVNAYFEDQQAQVSIPAELKPSLLMMKEVSKLLRTQREALGATEFETIESGFVVDHHGKVLDVYERTRGDGELMIEDFMVIANHCAANYFDVHQLPSLYRVHERPKQKKMQALSAILRVLGYQMKGKLANVYPADIQRVLYHFRHEPTYPMVSSLVLRSMMKAKYHPENLGHFGLGLKQYLHFTSPIRRYPDLVVHRLMKKYNFNQQIDPKTITNDENELVDTALWTSDRERNAVNAERDVEKMKKAEYMVDYIGEVYEGVISGVTGFGLFVQLPNTCEGLVHVRHMPEYFIFDEQKLRLVGEHSGTIYQLGQIVKVKVDSVDMVDYEVSLRLVDHKVNNDKKKNRNRENPRKKFKRNRQKSRV